MVSDLITIESLAIDAFATDQEIALWKTQVLNEERTKTQVLDVTNYIQHTNLGSPIHANGTYSQGGHRDGVERHNKQGGSYDASSYTRNGGSGGYNWRDNNRRYDASYNAHNDKYSDVLL